VNENYFLRIIAAGNLLKKHKISTGIKNRITVITRLYP
jgi:hypothetical protein